MSTPRKSMRKCEVCGISKSTNNVFLARFPQNPDRCRAWVKAVGNEDLVYLPIQKLHELKFVCGEHFSRKDFTKKRCRLKRTAVPTTKLSNPPITDKILEEFPLTVELRKTLVTAKNNIQANCENVQSRPPDNHPEHINNPTSENNNTCKASEESSLRSLKRLITNHDHSYCQTMTDELDNIWSKGYVEVSDESKKRKLMSTRALQTCAQIDQADIESEDGNKGILENNNTCEASEESSLRSLKRLITNHDHSYCQTMTDELDNIWSKGYVEVSDESKKRKLMSTRALQTCAQIDQADKELTHRKKGVLGSEMTLREKKLLKKLENTRLSLKTLAKSSIKLDQINSDMLKTIVTQAVSNQSRKAQGRRWNMAHKISCLAIFKRSPKTYRFLQHQMPIPSIRTLQRLLRNIPMNPGINPVILKHLENNALKLQTEDKLCCLLFDEISLKKRLNYNESTDKVEGYEDFGPGEGKGRTNRIADHALVLMIQGLRKKYKQPIAYYFVHSTISSQKLAVIIKEAVRSLQQVGFKVLATVCDQGPTNVGALNLLKKLSGHPHPPDGTYFCVDETKVFIVYDVPHLFKSIRNNFYGAGSMKFDGKIAKWEHLIDAEKINHDFLYFHKISPIILNPKQRMKMKVKYAVQVLSNTFAAVLKMIAKYNENTQYGREVADTAYVIQELDKLFDATNGPASPHDVKKGLRENVSNKTNHIESWNEFLPKLHTIEFLKSDSKIQLDKVRCIKGYEITISSFKDIWKYCKERKFKYLNLRQLNQDALENLFGVIRQTSPTNRNPTCSHFVSAIKTAVITRLSAPHSRGSNCSNDNNTLLFNLMDKNEDLIDEVRGGVNKSTYDNLAVCEDYPVLSIPDDDDDFQLESDLTELKNQPLVFLSGYIAYRLTKNITCKLCRDCLTIEAGLENPMYNYIQFREWWKNKASLTYPSVILCRLIECLVSLFKRHVNDMFIDDIGLTIKTRFISDTSCEWFQCHEHKDSITRNLYIIISRILIRRHCQIINEEFVIGEEASANYLKIAQAQNKAK